MKSSHESLAVVRKPVIKVERGSTLAIGADLMEFFSTHVGHSLEAFLLDYAQHKANPWEIWSACRRLEEWGYLSNLTGSPWLVEAHHRGHPPFHTQYFARLYNQTMASYGVYDFIALGFPHIREHFAKSVRAVFVTKSNSDEDVGSGFVLTQRRFVTARHCIERMKDVMIDGWVSANAPLTRIWTPAARRIDLAVLEFDGEPFPGAPGFWLGEVQILDEILTMGYPPMPGFQSVLVAETAQIAGHLQSSTGKVVAEEPSYLDNQTYLLISARVKGGNSGGPVIRREGMVVGVVTHLLAESEGRPDTLGYGVAIPSTTLVMVLEACKSQSALVQQVQFTPTAAGFKTAT